MNTPTRTRAEHMAWCQQRALAETNPQDMLASFVSDVAKHPDTAILEGFAAQAGLFHLNSVDGMRRFIEGFAR